MKLANPKLNSLSLLIFVSSLYIPLYVKLAFLSAFLKSCCDTDVTLCPKLNDWPVNESSTLKLSTPLPKEKQSKKPKLTNAGTEAVWFWSPVAEPDMWKLFVIS